MTFEPKAENKTLANERPMALLIMRVSKMPEAPTMVPATIKTFDPMVNPLAATAKPVKELRSEIKTGTSAPPIGSTKAMPRMKERTSRTQRKVIEGETSRATMMAGDVTPKMALMSCCPG